MRNIHEVLQQKEAECARLRHEIEALRVVVPLLDEQKAVTDRASVRDEKRVDTEPSRQEADEREAVATTPAEIDMDRKGPLAASLGETSWWRRQSSR